MSAAHDIFIELAAPLLIALPANFGLALGAGGRVTFDKIETDAIDIKRADGKVWRLLLDPKTHLPVALTWRAKPIVMMSTSTTMTTTVVQGKGGLAPAVPPPNLPPPNLPPGDPTAGLADVDWVTRIRDYKVADGLNWPRRFVTSFDGKEWEDVRISRYRINPKIDLKIFERKNK